MDLENILTRLYEERETLSEAIKTLEAMVAQKASEPRPEPKRRGRKGMSQGERLEVSRRMKAYWAARRSK